MNDEMLDYSITWGYIVNQMEKQYGIKVDSDEKYSMGEIKRYIRKIWDSFCDEKESEEEE